MLTQEVSRRGRSRARSRRTMSQPVALCSSSLRLLGRAAVGACAFVAPAPWPPSVVHTCTTTLPGALCTCWGVLQNLYLFRW